MPRVGGALTVGLGLALSSCGEEPQVSAMLPAVRVLDVVRASASGRRVYGVDVTLQRDTRRTLTLPASWTGTATLEEQRYRLTPLPNVAYAWGRIQIVRSTLLGNKTVVLPPHIIDLAAGAEPTVALEPLETPQPKTPFTISPVAPERLPTVETDAFTVPSGALLVFAVGVHAAAPRLKGAIGARVAVLDGGTRRVVWKAALPTARAGWQPARVSLAAFAGRTVRLRFTTHPGPAAAAGLTAVFGEPLVLAPRARASHPLNVVLVSMDTLRARSVGTYGCERPTTPTIDALGASGVVFENAFSTAAFTLPGHMSMLTGLWFRTHRALTRMSVLPPERRTLAQTLQAAGYATAAFTAGSWIVPSAGFRRGFDVYCEHRSTRESPGGAPPYETFTRGLDWMRTNRDRPLFLFLHNYVVHWPYEPPAPYDRMFDVLATDAPRVEKERLAYEQEVRYGDDQIRAFLEGLDATGLADRTLVVVTADHGEQFGEHGGSNHTYTVYDEVARVPLVMRLPGAIRAGIRLAEPVSLADVVPTIVDLVGLPPVYGADGTSLLPLVAGTIDRLPRAGVFTEAESEENLGWADLAAVHTRTHSCIHRAREGRDECWERRIDPWEIFPPLPADSTETRSARSALAAFMASKTPPGAPERVKAVAAPPPSPHPADQMDAERIEQLRALGYVVE